MKKIIPFLLIGVFFMARGTPDYHVPDYVFFSVETTNSDLFAERFGFSRLDNRGRVLWIDDFHQGLTRWKVTSDSGGTNPVHVYLSPFALGYGGSIRLDPLVNSGISTIYNQLLLPVSKRLGIEVGLYPVSSFGRISILLSHSFLTGTSKAAQLYIEHQTGNVVVPTTGGNQTIFAPATVGDFQNRWVSLKLTADYSTGKFHKLMLGNTEYDLSAYTMSNSVTGLAGATFIEILSEGRTATYKEEFYLGYVVVSGDEP